MNKIETADKRAAQSELMALLDSLKGDFSLYQRKMSGLRHEQEARLAAFRTEMDDESVGRILEIIQTQGVIL